MIKAITENSNSLSARNCKLKYIYYCCIETKLSTNVNQVSGIKTTETKAENLIGRLRIKGAANMMISPTKDTVIRSCHVLRDDGNFQPLD